MKMVEIDIHAILRKQKKKPPDKPVEIDYFWEAWLLLCIWAWGMGYTYGEVIATCLTR